MEAVRRACSAAPRDGRLYPTGAWRAAADDDIAITPETPRSRYTGRRAASLARGDAGEDAFARGERARRLFRVLLAHVEHAVDPRGLVNRRQVFLRPSTYARDLRALGGMHADDLDVRVMFLEIARGAHV